MLVEQLIYGIILVALLVGSYTDLRKREVADWLNYSLIFAGIGIRLIATLVEQDWSYLLKGLFGFLAMFLLALLMFYTGQWGGGDAKMIMGIGVLIGLEFNRYAFLLHFLVNVLIFGALFGLLYSLYLVIRNHKAFGKEFAKKYSEKKMTKWFVWGGTLVLLLAAVFVPAQIKVPVALLAALLLVSFYSFIYLKSVEKAAMLKWLDPEALVEGDWVVEEVKAGKKLVCGPKDLGLDESQIQELIKLKKRGRLKKVLVKDGFPFVPGFLIAFIATYLWGNVMLNILGISI
jgi:Flp pilus assembly protein protease CpaA